MDALQGDKRKKMTAADHTQKTQSRETAYENPVSDCVTAFLSRHNQVTQLSQRCNKYFTAFCLIIASLQTA